MEELKKKCQAIITEHAKVLNQLEKFTKIGHTISEIRYILQRLDELGPWKPAELTQDAVYEIVMLQTALAVCYGRLFTSGNTTKINPKDIPEELQEVHSELMSLRHKRFSHHDDHQSITTDLEFGFDGKTMLVYHKLSIQMTLGVPEKTPELIDWISGHMKQKSEKALKHLNDKSGYDWKTALPSDDE
ncbi:hypothetical protein [Pseudophaeobacter sp. A-200-2]|uniref:hypothetical protein n=1 Tax=Pseudophaeobacter sp. A-200-2 TaxID=3098145 RepID=UPI0034D561AD